MKKLLLITLLTAVISTSVQASTAFLKLSYISGANRICIYDNLGSEVAITVKSYRICPTSIDV